jgi:hypothetical protein
VIGAKTVYLAHPALADRHKDFIWAELVAGESGICVTQLSLADQRTGTSCITGNPSTTLSNTELGTGSEVRKAVVEE